MPTHYGRRAASEMPSYSRRAGSVASRVDDDIDVMRTTSRRQDSALLNDITARMCRLDFEAVKPSLDVSMQTGFRRHLYGKKHTLTPEVKHAIKRDRMLYPYDYTKENLFRAKKRIKKKEVEKIKEKYDEGIDPYPIHDPFENYRKREKPIKRIALEDVDTSIKDKYDKMTPRQIMAKAKAKAAMAPTSRDPVEDIDLFLEELSRPLPKTQVADYVPATGSLYDFEVSYNDGQRLDDRLSDKIKASRDELAEFERLMNERMRRPRVSAAELERRAAATAAAQERDRQREDAIMNGEYDLGLDDYYGLEDEIGVPTRPIPGTRTVISASHGFRSGGVSGRPPLPHHPRTRKYLDEEEVESYTPTSYKSLRSQAADCRSKLDQQRTMLDRYLPTPTGVPVPVEYEIQAKYGELAARLPYLEQQPRIRDRSYRSHSQPPPSRPRPTGHSKTSYDSLMRRTPSCRPPVSDVRKHAREVLCKTKNDPTYYNY